MPSFMQPNLGSSDGQTAQTTVGSTYEWESTKWIYIQAPNAPVPAYTPLIIGTPSLQAALLTYTAASTTYVVGTVVVPQFVMAANDYGWAIMGPANLVPFNTGAVAPQVLAASGVTAQSVTAVLTYTNTSNNSVSQTSGSNALIYGMIITSANSSGSVAAVTFAANRTLGIGG